MFCIRESVPELSIQQNDKPTQKYPEEVVIPPPSNQQVGEQSVHVTETGPNPWNIEGRTTRDDMRTDGENNIPINQVSENVMPSLSIGDNTQSKCIHRIRK